MRKNVLCSIFLLKNSLSSLNKYLNLAAISWRTQVTLVLIVLGAFIEPSATFLFLHFIFVSHCCHAKTVSTFDVISIVLNEFWIITQANASTAMRVSLKYRGTELRWVENKLTTALFCFYNFPTKIVSVMKLKHITY